MNYRNLFKHIWILKCPRKICIALWKFVRHFIPKKLSLFNKRIAQDPIFPRCLTNVEDINHVIHFCGFVKGVWDALQYVSPIIGIVWTFMSGYRGFFQ